ncbi:MAG: hypothetical protein AAF481_01340 [Acidobacteriota bacterium]
MKKSEVYSWRLDARLKAELEAAAREEETSMSHLLEGIVTRWLAGRSGEGAAVEERMRREARACFGVLRGGDPDRSSRVRERVRERLRQNHGS